MTPFFPIFPRHCGRTFTIDNVNELADVATKIGVELRNQYVLGYRPTYPERNGKWRKIKVKVNTPKDIGLAAFEVNHKKGYFAPTGDDISAKKKK